MESREPILNRNPFPGLRPFAPDESDLFFGRAEETAAVLEKLVDNRFVAVIGASGCGKSSLINCGVVPGMKKRLQAEDNLKTIMFRPGNNPVEGLCNVIIQSLPSNLSSCTDILSILKSGVDGLIAGIRSITSDNDDKVLLIIDQFEELFRFSSLSVGVDIPYFIDDLAKMISQADSGIYTIITMRSDFLGECAHFPKLVRLINNSNLLIPYMNRENYKQVIVGPVHYFNASIEDELVETLLNDISKFSDQLPVLQHTMMRVWSAWVAAKEYDRPISIKDYETIGTIDHAMSLHADEAYNELDDNGKKICGKFFKAITEQGSDNRGIRRPSSIGEIKSIVNCSDEELLDVINKFRVNTRSFIVPAQDVALCDESIIDLSHESLMRLWNRLVKWVAEEDRSIKICQNLCDAAENSLGNRTGLLKQPDLQVAVNWRNQQKPTAVWAKRYGLGLEKALAYLKASEDEYNEEENVKAVYQKRQVVKTRVLTVLLGVAALISIAFMLFALKKVVISGQEKELVEQKVANLKLSEQMAYSQVDSVLAEKLQADKKLSQVTENEEATLKLLQQARVGRQHAELQLDSAFAISSSASRQIDMANEEKEAMSRLRMLSVARSMSVRSLQLEGKSDLQSLLAYQAYLFNKDNNGLENDADIYAGLANVAKIYGSTELKNFAGHSAEITSIVFAPDSDEFYTSGLDGKILKWSLSSKNNSSTLVYDGNDIIRVLAISSDGKLLALGGNNASIIILSANDFAIKHVLNGHVGQINSLKFSNHNRYLYSASHDGKVFLWDMSTQRATELNTKGLAIASIDLSADGKYLAGISDTGLAIVWDVENLSDSFNPSTQGGKINVIRFNPDESIVAVGDDEGNVALWDIANHSKISEVKAHEGSVNDIQFNTYYKQMATAGNDKSIKIYNNILDLREPPIVLTDNVGPIVALRFSEDGQYIVSGVYESKQNLVSRPVQVEMFIKDICSLLTRNMTQEEWDAYVARDIPFENTCEDKTYNIKINVVR